MPLSNRIVLTQSLMVIAAESWDIDPDKLFVDVPLNEQYPHLTPVDLASFTLMVERDLNVDVSDQGWRLNETIHQWVTRLREALDGVGRLPWPRSNRHIAENLRA
jgi:hypothetical protein